MILDVFYLFFNKLLWHDSRLYYFFIASIVTVSLHYISEFDKIGSQKEG